ncbi:MAG TPA: hypothetical protein VGD31_02315, partial [Sphingobacteriaceae bacterium]
EAFISKDASTFEVRQIPILKKEENVMRDSMSLHLVNNEIVGKGKTSLTGFPKTFSSAELDRAGTNDIKRFVATLIGKGSNKFFLDQFKLSELHNQDKPVEVFYDFRISDYFQKSGNEIYLNLNLSKDYFNYFINPETRKTPLEIDYTYLKEEVIVLTIPEGFELEYVPEDYSYSGKFIGCKLLYDRGVNGKIILKKQFYLDSILITPADFQSWNDDIRNVSTNYKEAIILKRKS